MPNKTDNRLQEACIAARRAADLYPTDQTREHLLDCLAHYAYDLAMASEHEELARIANEIRMLGAHEQAQSITDFLSEVLLKDAPQKPAHDIQSGTFLQGPRIRTRHVLRQLLHHDISRYENKDIYVQSRDDNTALASINAVLRRFPSSAPSLLALSGQIAGQEREASGTSLVSIGKKQIEHGSITSGFRLMLIGMLRNPNINPTNCGIDFDSFDEKDVLEFFELGVVLGIYPNQGFIETVNKIKTPFIFLNTIPKSGSMFLLNALSLTLGSLSMRIAHGSFHNANLIVPGLLKVAMGGGILAQQHLHASPYNILALKQANLRKFILHLRDPRQAVLSYYHDEMRRRNNSGYDIDKDWLLNHFPIFWKWIEGWVHILDNEQDFNIFLSSHEKLAGNEINHIENILRFYGMEIPREQIIMPPKNDATHFRKGQINEWVDVYDNKTKLKMWKSMSRELCERFGWLNHAGIS